MFKSLILIVLLGVVINTRCQDIFILGESEIVHYNAHDEIEALDSLVFISVPGKYMQWENIEVYYDSTFDQLVYKSFSAGDSCHTYHYWRNGQLKKHVIYIRSSDNFPHWWWYEAYCSNGQLIYKGASPNQSNNRLETRYYCNGKKQSEFYCEECPYGEIRYWYPSGVLKERGFRNKDCMREGEWRYYLENGLLAKVEVYLNGELVRVSKHE